MHHPRRADVLAYLRKPGRLDSEIVEELEAMAASQPKDDPIADHLDLAASRINEGMSDQWEDEKPEPNNGRGEFDRASGAIPAWMTLSGGF